MQDGLKLMILNRTSKICVSKREIYPQTWQLVRKIKTENSAKDIIRPDNAIGWPVMLLVTKQVKS